MTTTTVELNRFQTEVRMLSFHPDDVPLFELYEALELLREILVYEWGWNPNGSHELTWGDSGTPTMWYVNVGPFNTIEVTCREDRETLHQTTFKGPWRTITRQALLWIADNSTAA